MKEKHMYSRWMDELIRSKSFITKQVIGEMLFYTLAVLPHSIIMKKQGDTTFKLSEEMR